MDSAKRASFAEENLGLTPFDEWWRILAISACCWVMAVDSGRVPGFHWMWWLLGYGIAGTAVIVWKLTYRYESLIVFGASLYAVTCARIGAFAYFELRDRISGIAINVLALLFAQGFVSRRRRLAIAKWKG